MSFLLLAELASDLPCVSGSSPMRDDDFRNGAGEGKLPFDICMVCGDKASGRHYGAISCEGCKGFFKRSIRKHLGYICRSTQTCEVTKHCRNRCQYCRLQKCLSVGMRTDSVQLERRHLELKDFKLEKPVTPPLTNSSQNYGIWNSGFPALGYLNDVTSELVPASSADLSTLTSVVTTLASMKYWQQDRQADSSSGSSGAVNNNNTGGDVLDDGITEPNTGGLDAVLSRDKTIISYALDNIAKAALEGSEVEDVMNQEEQMSDHGEEGDNLFELEGPLLQDCQVAFHLTAPHSAAGASFLNEHYICESASRLLFLSVQWAKSVPAFQLLTPQVQATLVRYSWSELFTLGLAQCSQIMSLPTILTAITGHLQTSTRHDRSSALHVRQVTDHISKLQDFVKSMLRLQVDDHEYAYLKVLILFSPDHPSLPSARQVEKFQEKAYQELRSYINQTFPETNDRFPRLLLRLPVLRSLQSLITEELFFSALIGNVQIESIIPYILKMDSSEYTSLDGSLSSDQPAKAKD